ncbi:MAG: GNAT family N-acetyltransferase [Saprospiraceae bacterium]|nr:GNAT family N-acetyltransferase [Saprospiraceae bacterium]
MDNIAPNEIELATVTSRSDLKQFVDFQYKLYRDNPYYVPPLRNDEIQTFSPSHNPAYEHCEAKLFLAKKAGEVVGRIAGIINHQENNGAENRAARFGWVDFIDDYFVSKKLFDAVEGWARERGCLELKGPYGFSNMDKAGLLIEGFEELATMAVIYNFPYYSKHIERLGFEKLVDWKEFEATVPKEIPARVIKFAEMIKERYGVKEFHPRNKAELNEMGFKIFDLINLTYQDLEGFIPHSNKQIALFVKKYISLINPDFISVILNEADELVGFGITMPSFSKALQKSKGRLFPFGIFHLRKAMKKNDRADLYLIAVRPDYQSKGITALIFSKIIETCIRYGIKKAETNPELESNQDVQNLWRGYEMRLHKRRRCYIKKI